MAILISILVCGCLTAFWLHVIQTRRFVEDLTRSVRSRQHLLANQSAGYGLKTLLAETNKLIDRHNDYAENQTARLKQLETILSSIQETVIIFSKDREIEYANDSAEKLFCQKGRLQGQRLESVLRAPNLIEYLGAPANNSELQPQQLSLERYGELLWFEVSCTKVRDLNETDDVSMLLVLHDITQLKQLEEIQKDFVANVSHELRTPVTIIKGYTETLIDDDKTLSAENRLRFLKKIERNAHRLHLLVEDLLLLSRLESKPEQIRPATGSLRQLIDEILEDYHSRLDQEKQQVVLAFDEQIGDFAFDRFRIRQVFDNLIENIFKYAHGFTEMRLEVRFDEAKNSVCCSVTDDGAGIPEKDLPHIFKRFYRVDKGRLYENGGTGLGLSIMKHIIQQHGGTVRAESKPGQGTSIHFSLPYLRVADPLNVER